MSEKQHGWRTGAFLVGLLLLPLVSWSQAPENNRKRAAIAKFTDEKIKVDGELTEPAWQTAEGTAGFLQQDPVEGAPASETTEVRVLFDKENLYIGAYCHDRTPARIVINDISRDFDTMNEDYFAVVLDTFNDDRNGYYLATTAAGGQKDSQIFDEGRYNNINWDGVWFVETQRHEEGYTVEMAIPFKTLRFSQAKKQVWGVHFLRRMRDRNEADYWSLPPRRYSLTRAIPYAGELRGIENVEPGRNFQVKPYFLGGVKGFASRDKDAEGEFDGGVDVKYGITPGLTLDLTANTDFSHVEVDTQQVNLTRFPLFFPEKREFFLENAGIFQFGALQRNEALLFHSRTIGLESGEPIPILGGARLTGRAGKNYLGLLNMQTRSERSAPATNFTVARVRRDILGASNVGALFLNRQSRLRDDYNRSFGADANLIFFQTDLRLTGLLARTVTPRRDRDDRIGKLEGEYQNNWMRVLSSYTEIGKNFNPEMGFVRRPGRRIFRNELEGRARLSPATRLGSLMRDLFATVTSEHLLLSNGLTETKLLEPEVNIEFQDGSVFVANHTQNFERVREPFALPFSVQVPAADYRFNHSFVSYSSNRSKPLSGNVGYGWGDFYGGTGTQWILGGRFHPNYRLSASVDYERTNIELPQGAFTTELLGARVNYSFNPKMFLNAFIQYNNETDQLPVSPDPPAVERHLRGLQRRARPETRLDRLEPHPQVHPPAEFLAGRRFSPASRNGLKILVRPAGKLQYPNPKSQTNPNDPKSKFQTG